MSAAGRAARRWAPAAVLLAALAVLAGCGWQPGPVAAERIVRLSGPAGERDVAVYHPDSAGPGAPLVIVLHGANGSGQTVRRSFGWDSLASRDGFVVAYPDALDGRWNAGVCCRRWNSRKVDDVAFLHQLRARLVADDRVDPHRVFAVGASNGGMLSYAWACSRPGDLAAIGVVSGALTVPCPAPTPLTVVAIHGTSDTVLPPAGGPGPLKGVNSSLDDALRPFRAAAACPAEPEVATAGAASVATWYCADGRKVVRDVIDGAGHGWPGSGGKAGTGTGPTDSTGFLWNVLRAVPAAPAR